MPGTSEIECRFGNELEYIERYVKLLRAKSTVHDRQVLDLNRILIRVQINPLPTRHYDRAGIRFARCASSIDRRYNSAESVHAPATALTDRSKL